MHVLDRLGRIKVTDSGPGIVQYMLKNQAGGSWRVKNFNLQFWNITTLRWHTLFLSGPIGHEQSAWGAGDSSPPSGAGFMEMVLDGNSWRVKENNLQFYNTTTSKWHTLILMGPIGHEQPAWGAGED